MPTSNIGLNTLASTNPEYEGGNSPIALLSANMTTLDAKFQMEIETASGTIGIKEGTSVITKAGVAAMTLAAPTAGLPANGGDDGKLLYVLSTTAYAHTVTTPSNALNGSYHTATFAASAGNVLALRAYNGVWYQMHQTGITLS